MRQRKVNILLMFVLRQRILSSNKFNCRNFIKHVNQMKKAKKNQKNQKNQKNR